MNSREKGKRGEREWAWFLRALGCHKARRGVQYAGGAESPDVVAGIPGTHCEVKRCERLRLWEALDQATRDAEGLIPYIAHKANRGPWVVVLRAEDLMAFARGLAAIDGRPIYPEADDEVVEDCDCGDGSCNSDGVCPA